MIVDKKQLPFVKQSARIDKMLVDPMRPDGDFVHHVVESFDTSEFDRKFIAYLGERAAHRFTVGVAAPWPEHEALRIIAERIEQGDNLELIEGDQFAHDYDAAYAFNEKRGARGAPDQIPQRGAPTIWARMADAWKVLTGKVKV